MKKTLLLFVIVCLISSLQAQKEKELTLDLVFKSREFSAKRAQGLQPLQDGKRYIQQGVYCFEHRWVVGSGV